jgi:hypothetical protein
LAHGKRPAPTPFHETLGRSDLEAVTTEKRSLFEAIFTASPHVPNTPQILTGRYAVFEITRIERRRLQSFQRVRGSI